MVTPEAVSEGGRGSCSPMSKSLKPPWLTHEKADYNNKY